MTPMSCLYSTCKRKAIKATYSLGSVRRRTAEREGWKKVDKEEGEKSARECRVKRGKASGT
jgi:hypothetical protein